MLSRSRRKKNVVRVTFSGQLTVRGQSLRALLSGEVLPQADTCVFTRTMSGAGLRERKDERFDICIRALQLLDGVGERPARGGVLV